MALEAQKSYLEAIGVRRLTGMASLIREFEGQIWSTITMGENGGVSRPRGYEEGSLPCVFWHNLECRWKRHGRKNHFHFYKITFHLKNV